MMWGWDTAGGWLMMGFGMIIWVVVIALVVWLFVRATGPRPTGGGTSESAEELLRRRFAAGEIDAEEYQRRLETLRRG